MKVFSQTKRCIIIRFIHDYSNESGKEKINTSNEKVMITMGIDIIKGYRINISFFDHTCSANSFDSFDY